MCFSLKKIHIFIKQHNQNTITMKHLKHLLTVFLLLLVFKAHANEHKTLVVEMYDGSTASFLLADKPKITFASELIKITSERYSMEFLLSDVKKYHFAEKEVSTAITETLAESKATLEDNMLIVTGIDVDETITIYTIDGISVKQATAINGSCYISLNELSNGIYIVTFNNTTFKFLKQ